MLLFPQWEKRKNNYLRKDLTAFLCYHQIYQMFLTFPLFSPRTLQAGNSDTALSCRRFCRPFALSSLASYLHFWSWTLQSAERRSYWPWESVDQEFVLFAFAVCHNFVHCILEKLTGDFYGHNCSLNKTCESNNFIFLSGKLNISSPRPFYVTAASFKLDHEIRTLILRIPAQFRNCQVNICWLFPTK